MDFSLKTISLIAFSLFCLFVACAPDLTDKNSEGILLPKNIRKFQDGNVTCWIYLEKGISCVKIYEK